MMHPKHERLRVLGQALDTAGQLLDDPIDRLEVTNSHIRVWADGRRLTFRYQYNNAYSPEGGVMPGSGHWSVELIDKGGDSAGWLAGLFRRR